MVSKCAWRIRFLPPTNPHWVQVHCRARGIERFISIIHSGMLLSKEQDVKRTKRVGLPSAYSPRAPNARRAWIVSGIRTQSPGFKSQSSTPTPQYLVLFSLGLTKLVPTRPCSLLCSSSNIPLLGSTSSASPPMFLVQDGNTYVWASSKRCKPPTSVVFTTGKQSSTACRSSLNQSRPFRCVAKKAEFGLSLHGLDTWRMADM